MTAINGYVDEGYGAVYDAFQQNFIRKKEIGAACAIYYRGRKVVDLWGGYVSSCKAAKWAENTLVPVFSTTKGISALTVAAAVSQGLFSYEDAVSKIWPAFGTHQKAHLTIRTLLAHQAGLCALDEAITPEIIRDHQRLSTILARQKPLWHPGDYQGYHCWNLGWYQSELIRQSDKRRRTLGQFFKEEIADKLNIEFYIGLPPRFNPARIATLKSFPKALMLFKMPPGLVFSFLNPGSLVMRTMGNPRFLLNHHNLNRPEFQALEIGSGNGIGNARSIAALYSEFAVRGNRLNIKPAVLNALEAHYTPPKRSRKDRVFHINIPFLLGFMKPGSRLRFGMDHTSYGFWGAGGSCGFADPAAGVGYSYVMNKMGCQMLSDPREKAIREAFYQCI